MMQTQAIEFEDVFGTETQNDSVLGLPQLHEPVQVGFLVAVEGIPQPQEERHPLYVGCNVIARNAVVPHRSCEDRISEWQGLQPEYSVHGVFIDHASVSSIHAHIYVEDHGQRCFVKDLRSRNKTFLQDRLGRDYAISPGDRYHITPGDSVRFGSYQCILHIEPPSLKDAQPHVRHAALDTQARPESVTSAVASPPQHQVVPLVSNQTQQQGQQLQLQHEPAPKDQQQFEPGSQRDWRDQLSAHAQQASLPDADAVQQHELAQTAAPTAVAAQRFTDAAAMPPPPPPNKADAALSAASLRRDAVQLSKTVAGALAEPHSVAAQPPALGATPNATSAADQGLFTTAQRLPAMPRLEPIQPCSSQHLAPPTQLLAPPAAPTRTLPATATMSATAQPVVVPTQVLPATTAALLATQPLAPTQHLPAPPAAMTTTQPVVGGTPATGAVTAAPQPVPHASQHLHQQQTAPPATQPVAPTQVLVGQPPPTQSVLPTQPVPHATHSAPPMQQALPPSQAVFQGMAPSQPVQQAVPPTPSLPGSMPPTQPLPSTLPLLPPATQAQPAQTMLPPTQPASATVAIALQEPPSAPQQRPPTLLQRLLPPQSWLPSVAVPQPRAQHAVAALETQPQHGEQGPTPPAPTAPTQTLPPTQPTTDAGPTSAVLMQAAAAHIQPLPQTTQPPTVYVSPPQSSPMLPPTQNAPTQQSQLRHTQAPSAAKHPRMLIPPPPFQRPALEPAGENAHLGTPAAYHDTLALLDETHAAAPQQPRQEHDLDVPQDQQTGAIAIPDAAAPDLGAADVAVAPVAGDQQQFPGSYQLHQDPTAPGPYQLVVRAVQPEAVLHAPMLISSGMPAPAEAPVPAALLEFLGANSMDSVWDPEAQARYTQSTLSMPPQSAPPSAPHASNSAPPSPLNTPPAAGTPQAPSGRSTPNNKALKPSVGIIAQQPRNSRSPDSNPNTSQPPAVGSIPDSQPPESIHGSHPGLQKIGSQGLDIGERATASHQHGGQAQQDSNSHSKSHTSADALSQQSQCHASVMAADARQQMLADQQPDVIATGSGLGAIASGVQTDHATAASHATAPPVAPADHAITYPTYTADHATAAVAASTADHAADTAVDIAAAAGATAGGADKATAMQSNQQRLSGSPLNTPSPARTPDLDMTQAPEEDVAPQSTAADYMATQLMGFPQSATIADRQLLQPATQVLQPPSLGMPQPSTIGVLQPTARPVEAPVPPLQSPTDALQAPAQPQHLMHATQPALPPPPTQLQLPLDDSLHPSATPIQQAPGCDTTPAAEHAPSPVSPPDMSTPRPGYGLAAALAALASSTSPNSNSKAVLIPYVSPLEQIQSLMHPSATPPGSKADHTKSATAANVPQNVARSIFPDSDTAQHPIPTFTAVPSNTSAKLVASPVVPPVSQPTPGLHLATSMETSLSLGASQLNTPQRVPQTGPLSTTADASFSFGMHARTHSRTPEPLAGRMSPADARGEMGSPSQEVTGLLQPAVQIKVEKLQPSSQDDDVAGDMAAGILANDRAVHDSAQQGADSREQLLELTLPSAKRHFNPQPRQLATKADGSAEDGTAGMAAEPHGTAPEVHGTVPAPEGALPAVAPLTSAANVTISPLIPLEPRQTERPGSAEVVAGTPSVSMIPCSSLAGRSATAISDTAAQETQQQAPDHATGNRKDASQPNVSMVQSSQPLGEYASAFAASAQLPLPQQPATVQLQPALQQPSAGQLQHTAQLHWSQLLATAVSTQAPDSQQMRSLLAGVDKLAGCLEYTQVEPSPTPPPPALVSPAALLPTATPQLPVSTPPAAASALPPATADAAGTTASFISPATTFAAGATSSMLPSATASPTAAAASPRSATAALLAALMPPVPASPVSSIPSPRSPSGVSALAILTKAAEQQPPATATMLARHMAATATDAVAATAKAATATALKAPDRHHGSYSLPESLDNQPEALVTAHTDRDEGDTVESPRRGVLKHSRFKPPSPKSAPHAAHGVGSKPHTVDTSGPQLQVANTRSITTADDKAALTAAGLLKGPTKGEQGAAIKQNLQKGKQVSYADRATASQISSPSTGTVRSMPGVGTQAALDALHLMANGTPRSMKKTGGPHSASGRSSPSLATREAAEALAANVGPRGAELAASKGGKKTKRGAAASGTRGASRLAPLPLQTVAVAQQVPPTTKRGKKGVNGAKEIPQLPPHTDAPQVAIEAAAATRKQTRRRSGSKSREPSPAARAINDVELAFEAHASAAGEPGLPGSRKQHPTILTSATSTGPSRRSSNAAKAASREASPTVAIEAAAATTGHQHTKDATASAKQPVARELPPSGFGRARRAPKRLAEPTSPEEQPRTRRRVSDPGQATRAEGEVPPKHPVAATTANKRKLSDLTAPTLPHLHTVQTPTAAGPQSPVMVWNGRGKRTKRQRSASVEPPDFLAAGKDVEPPASEKVSKDDPEHEPVMQADAEAAPVVTLEVQAVASAEPLGAATAVQSTAQAAPPAVPPALQTASPAVQPVVLQPSAVPSAVHTAVQPGSPRATQPSTSPTAISEPRSVQSDQQPSSTGKSPRILKRSKKPQIPGLEPHYSLYGTVLSPLGANAPTSRGEAAATTAEAPGSAMQAIATPSATAATASAQGTANDATLAEHGQQSRLVPIKEEHPADDQFDGLITEPKATDHVHHHERTAAAEAPAGPEAAPSPQPAQPTQPPSTKPAQLEAELAQLSGQPAQPGTRLSRQPRRSKTPEAEQLLLASVKQERLTPGSLPGSQTDTQAGGARKRKSMAATKDMVVVFSSSVGAADKRKYTAVIERLGGRVAGDKELEFTHLFTLPGSFTKSLKTLVAMAAGRPLVGPAWLDACKSANTFLDVRPEHLATDAAAERKLRFSLAHAYSQAQQGLLLQDRSVFLTPGLRKAEKDAGESLCQIARHAGGHVVEQPGQVTLETLVLGVLGDRAWANANLLQGCAVFDRERLVAGVLEQKLAGAKPLFKTTG